MGNPVIVEAVRTPIGKRAGWLAGLKPQALLAHAQLSAVTRSGVDPSVIGQIFAGCVTQAGEQGGHVGRYAWLYAGLPRETGATTVDCQCGSSQQAVHLAAAMVHAGVTTAAIGCGVEVMSRCPLGSNVLPASPRPDDWSIDIPDQFNVVAKYPIGLVKGASNPAGARAFITYVLSPTGQAILKHYGFIPINGTARTP